MHVDTLHTDCAKASGKPGGRRSTAKLVDKQVLSTKSPSGGR
jgi:hypothetical protein